MFSVLTPSLLLGCAAVRLDMGWTAPGLEDHDGSELTFILNHQFGNDWWEIFNPTPEHLQTYHIGMD